MKYKAYLSMVLAAVLLFLLTACGKTQSPAAATESVTAAQQTELQTVLETTVEETIAEEPTVEEPTVEEPTVEETSEEAWKEELAESLFENYGVLPEYYEDLGNGIYQVYVEVGGEIVPFVTVDSATGDYHG